MSASGDWITTRDWSYAFWMVNYLASGIAGLYMAHFSGVEGREQFNWLALPCAGPFIAGATLGESFSDGARTALHIEGAVQTLSLALIFGAIHGHHHELGEAHEAAKKQKVALMPLVLPSGGGLGLGGSF